MSSTAPIVDNRCWISLRLTSGYQVWSAVQILFEFGLSLLSLNASLRSSQKGWKFTDVLLLVRQSGISKTSASYSSSENDEWVAQQNSTQRRIYFLVYLLFRTQDIPQSPSHKHRWFFLQSLWDLQAFVQNLKADLFVRRQSTDFFASTTERRNVWK